VGRHPDRHISGLFMALGGLDWEWTWVIVILYFTCIHSTLVMFGAYALSRPSPDRPGATR
jgi:hypothetical protein